MKSLVFAVIYTGLCAVGSAFTLDFNSVALGPAGSTFTVTGVTDPVTGELYGDVQFSTSDSLDITADFGFEPDRNLTFDDGEQVTVTFLGAEPLNVDFDYIGVSANETFLSSTTPDPNVFTVQFISTANNAGLFQISFDQVPEPSTSLLGAVAGSLLLLRRRR